MIELFDSHCHLTALDGVTAEDAIKGANSLGVTRFLCIGAGSGTNAAKDAVALATNSPQVFASVGIHPHDAQIGANIQELESLAENPRVVAIGETGLDYFKNWSPYEEQRRVFKETIAFAKDFKKPLIIHCRDAIDDTFKTLIEENAKDVGGVFHCYAGDVEFAKKLWDIGFYVSFPGTITFKKAENVRAAAKGIPIEQILIETDSPYLAPEPYRGKSCEPKHVYYVAEKLAEVKSITLEEVAKQTFENASRLFNLSSFA